MSEPKGGYTIDGNVNPFTGETIPQLNAHSWEQASLTELWEQMSVLNARMSTVCQLGKAEYIPPLRLAISQLEAIIRQRSQSTENLIT